MAIEESQEQTTAEKLQLLKSPLIAEDRSDTITLAPTKQATAPDLSLFGNRFEADCPQFQKHEDASLLELFFDLFFAANYTVFSQTQGVNSHDRFKAYVGYFSVLWITWLTVSLYDVRFVTDSLFERAARGVHLGVMVGFAVVAPKFTPDDQNVKTMRTMSIILMISRLCLAVEYASILWHIRKYKKQRLPMLMQIGMNVIVALVYLGITFRFRAGNSRVFIAWYVLAGVEVILTFAFANIWPVLSFQGTHLMKRMGLLTVMILGDGIIVIAQSVVTIVKSPDAWNSQTIGIVTAASATVYFVFLVYFDWMKNPNLPHVRQQIWTVIHFPFHLALVLFMQGFTQFVIWTKIIDTLKNLTLDSVFNDVNDIAKSTTQKIIDNLSKMMTDFFKLYPPKYASTWTTVENALTNISDIADDFWPQFAKYATTLQDKDFPDEDEFNTFAEAFYSISYSMENSLLETFGIDLVTEISEDKTNSNITENALEAKVNEQTWTRFELVFQYAYIAAGITLILMVLLTIVSRTTPWSKWSIVRTAIYTLLGIGMSLVALLNYSPTDAAKFQASAWMLPTITLVWVLIIFLTHIRNPPPLFFKGSQSFWSKKKSGPSYDYVMPNETQTEYKGAPNNQISQA
ncbi:uncharacterized protein NECHADRAFT_33885 [Fusarium vanettenii 77-13-4]|uniref:Low temperature requirement A n=1 Tax=Fusarium vanettenii (strain ATCC MYA-4622 / CBS 123669 / FGSC 9596 / NRRL 45880 / 77-13-4) TaxID=660122 RepID=C7Z6Y4_FUSV7|nr:uncharacterized protein NECHADRAFT_33885 [Fusarium vanettenii 77-13-4]EEU40210.1 hypothetical protein NECHADRAFT_33885 [Fusarium vanettenii 77-13-4]